MRRAAAVTDEIALFLDLRKQGHRVGHERVCRSVKRQQLRPVYKLPYRVITDSIYRKPIAEDVLDPPMESLFKTLKVSAWISCAMTGEHTRRRTWISLTGSRSSTIPSECSRSAIARR